MKHILITGVLGFIASHFANYMTEKYPDLYFIGIDKITYCSSFKNIEDAQSRKNFTFIKADICNYEFMDHIFRKYGVDTVVHFAAYSHVDLSFNNSLEFTYNNVVGTHILLEVARISKIERFINVGTDESFGERFKESMEDSPLHPTNPYSCSKTCSFLLGQTYNISYGLPVISTFGNNVYGPMQYPDKVIAKFSMYLLHDKTLKIQGKGLQRRSFLHVFDVVRAYETILFKASIGEKYNIGSKDEISILELAQRMIELNGNKGSIEYIKDRDFNDQRYLMNSDKLINLGWKQEIDFNKGLLDTFQWYEEHKEDWDINNL